MNGLKVVYHVINVFNNEIKVRTLFTFLIHNNVSDNEYVHIYAKDLKNNVSAWFRIMSNIVHGYHHGDILCSQQSK